MIVAGDNDDDILLAIRTVEETGRLARSCVRRKGVDVLPLPIAGLMSDRRYEGSHGKSSLPCRRRRENLVSPENVDPFVTRFLLWRLR